MGSTSITKIRVQICLDTNRYKPIPIFLNFNPLSLDTLTQILIYKELRWKQKSFDLYSIYHQGIKSLWSSLFGTWTSHQSLQLACLTRLVRSAWMLLFSNAVSSEMGPICYSQRSCWPLSTEERTLRSQRWWGIGETLNASFVFWCGGGSRKEVCFF